MNNRKLVNGMVAGLAALGAATAFYFSGKNDGKSEMMNPPLVENAAEYDIGSGLRDSNSRLPIEGLPQKTVQSPLEKKADVYSMNDSDYDAHIRTNDDYAFGLMGSYLDTDELRNTLGLEYFVEFNGPILEALESVSVNDIRKYVPQKFWDKHPELLEEINNLAGQDDSRTLEDVIGVPKRADIRDVWNPRAREAYARTRESELLGGYTASLPLMADVDESSEGYDEFARDKRTTHEIILDKYGNVFDFLKRAGAEKEDLDRLKNSIDNYYSRESEIKSVSAKNQYTSSTEERMEMQRKRIELCADLNSEFSGVILKRLRRSRADFEESLGEEGKRILALRKLCESYYDNKPYDEPEDG